VDSLLNYFKNRYVHEKGLRSFRNFANNLARYVDKSASRDTKISRTCAADGVPEYWLSQLSLQIRTADFVRGGGNPMGLKPLDKEFKAGLLEGIAYHARRKRAGQPLGGGGLEALVLSALRNCELYVDSPEAPLYVYDSPMGKQAIEDHNHPLLPVEMHRTVVFIGGRKNVVA
jgi:hypothetical protein